MTPSKASNAIPTERGKLAPVAVFGQPHQGHPSHVAKPFEHEVACHIDIMFVVDAIMALSKKLDIAWEDMVSVSTTGMRPKAKVPPEILVHWAHLLDNDPIVPCPRALPDTVDGTEGTVVYKADDTAVYNSGDSVVNNTAEVVDDVDL
ncbi:hypothetical protein HFD88_004839 [Aspergillus terreus]|nr:hypothetical protein HFD88_004839 [Aspergillus terreus]